MSSFLPYRLLDSGGGRKLEQFGSYRLIRPAAHALWDPAAPALWEEVDGIFSRDGGNHWSFGEKGPLEEWQLSLEGLRFWAMATDFGHVGLFPEHALLWPKKMIPLLTKRMAEPRLLNLFGYTGAATLMAAKAGAKVCHVDGSKTSVEWARENSKLNKLEEAPIRWIVEDVYKFLQREQRRQQRYEAIVLDPPSFGRGPKGELFKVEEQLPLLLELIESLLSETPLFVALTSHTPHFSPMVLANLLEQKISSKRRGKVSCGELLLSSEQGVPLPAGNYGFWQAPTPAMA